MVGVGEKGEGGRPHGGRPARGGPRAAQQAAKRPLWQKCTSCSRFPATNGNHPPNPGRPPARRCSVFSPNSTIFCYIILLFMFFFYKTAWAPKFAAAADEATADDGLSCPPPPSMPLPKELDKWGTCFRSDLQVEGGLVSPPSLPPKPAFSIPCSDPGSIAWSAVSASILSVAFSFEA